MNQCQTKILNYIYNVHCPNLSNRDACMSRLFSDHFPSYNTYYNESGAPSESDSYKTEFSGYNNSDSIYDASKCFSDSNLNYVKVCTKEEDEVITKAGNGGLLFVPATCQGQGGDGNAFGAGGGGGNAGDTPGIRSIGGKGGYGGVIIEW